MKLTGVQLFYRFYGLLKKHDIHVEKHLDESEYWLYVDEFLHCAVCLTYPDSHVDYIKVCYPCKPSIQYDDAHCSFRLSFHKHEEIVDNVEDLHAVFDKFLEQRNLIAMLKDVMTDLLDEATTETREASKTLSFDDLTELAYSKKRELEVQARQMLTVARL